MEYMNVAKAAELWGICDRRVRVLCKEGRIDGVIRQGKAYMIPVGAEKPEDKRIGTKGDYSDLLRELEQMKDELDRRRPLTRGELQRLRDEFLVEYTYDSNAIEGNTLTLQETALVLEGITIDKKPLKDHLEAVGHRDAFLYVQDLVRDKVPFSEFVIKQIHTLVLMDRPEDRGVYRRIPVQILGAFHVPTEPILIAEQMEKLVRQTKADKKHPIEKAALFHLKFEGIHPFVDGNGRTGRLILNLMLMQAGYPPINLKYADRRRYYEAFDAYYRDHDTGAMMRIVCDGVKERLEQLLQIVHP